LSTIPSTRKKTSVLSSSKGIQVNDFIVDKKLGEGKFGCVNLARHKQTNGLFALKKIPKALIKSNMMVDQLALEIRIQSCIKHPNIL
jgi:serine/threonine protein kinase